MYSGSKNPFYKLAISPFDSIEVILNKVDEMEEQFPQEDFKPVLNAIIDPKERIKAELFWFSDVTKENYDIVMEMLEKKTIPLTEADVKTGSWSDCHFDLGMEEEAYQNFRKYKSKYYNGMYDHGCNSFSLWSHSYNYPEYPKKPGCITGLSEINFYRYVFGVDYSLNILSAENYERIEKAILSINRDLLASKIIENHTKIEINPLPKDTVLNEVDNYLNDLLEKACQNFIKKDADREELSKNVKKYATDLKKKANKMVFVFYSDLVSDKISETREEIINFASAHNNGVSEVQNYVRSINFWSEIISPFIVFGGGFKDIVDDYLNTIEVIRKDIDKYLEAKDYDAANELSSALVGASNFYPDLSDELSEYHKEIDAKYREYVDKHGSYREPQRKRTDPNVFAKAFGLPPVRKSLIDRVLDFFK